MWRHRRRHTQDLRVEETKGRADDALHDAQKQEPKVDEVVRQAQSILRRSDRFTREVDKALRLRGV